jgi:hypothetical protein
LTQFIRSKALWMEKPQSTIPSESNAEGWNWEKNQLLKIS